MNNVKTFFLCVLVLHKVLYSMSTECANDFFSVEIDNVDKEKVYIECFGECKPNKARYRKNSLIANYNSKDCFGCICFHISIGCLDTNEFVPVERQPFNLSVPGGSKTNPPFKKLSFTSRFLHFIQFQNLTKPERKHSQHFAFALLFALFQAKV